MFSLFRNILSLFVLGFLIVNNVFATIYVTNPKPGNAWHWPGTVTKLWAVNEDGSGGYIIGNVTLQGKSIAIISIAMDANGTLYGFEYNSKNKSSRLLTIDRNTAVATVVGNGNYISGQINGTGFDRNGILWVLVFDDRSLNGVMQTFDIGNLSLFGNAFPIPDPHSKLNVNGGDIAFDLNGNCWFIGTFSDNSSTQLYSCDPVQETFDIVGKLKSSGFLDGGRTSVSGLAFSLSNDSCNEVLAAVDGYFTDEIGIVDLSSLTFFKMVAGINFSYYNHLDMAGFPTVRGTSNCGTCGDNILDYGEECDDGNTEDGDGCSSACLFQEVSDIPPLLVTIDSFSVARNNNKVKIKLVTGSETETAALQIHRAPSVLQNLQQIQEVCRWNGVGTNSGSVYSCKDENAPASVVYWPVEIENDGTTNNYLEFMTNVQ